MQEIMFSVAVITYNQEMYISQTLDSILNQEHDYKYEIVIGEDCSTDKTKQIIEEYVAKYPEIIKPLYNNPNKGLINNYFNVINHCQGKYIMECAGDDYWLPGKVKSQIEFMEKSPEVGMCYTKAKFWNENKQNYEKKLFGSDIESFEKLLTTGNKVPALSVCLRKNLAEQYVNEIKPQEKNWLMEDYPMWLWFSHECKVKFFDEVTAVYRVLENSASHSVDVEKQIKFQKNVRDIQMFFSILFLKIPFDFDENEDMFNLYFNFLRKEYRTDVVQIIEKYFYLLPNKSLKKYIKFLLSKAEKLFKIVF